MNKVINPSLDQYKGCLLGLTFGDALGAKFEGGYLERGLWYLLGKTNGRMRYTDDTQMTLDVIKSLLKCGKINQGHLAMKFANSYHWSRGYGPGAAKTLKQIKKGIPWDQANTSQFKDGSYGNGAAMRAPVFALFYQDKQELLKAVYQASEITHTHPLAIEGAQLVSLTVLLSLNKKSISQIIEELLKSTQQEEYLNKLSTLKQFHQRNERINLKQSRILFGNGIAAEKSCITAIMTSLQFFDKPYLEMIQFICLCGGDTDTIAAMAGAIWGAFNGFEAIEGVKVTQIEKGEEIEKLAKKIYES